MRLSTVHRSHLEISVAKQLEILGSEECYSEKKPEFPWKIEIACLSSTARKTGNEVSGSPSSYSR